MLCAGRRVRLPRQHLLMLSHQALPQQGLSSAYLALKTSNELSNPPAQSTSFNHGSNSSSNSSSSHAAHNLRPRPAMAMAQLHCRRPLGHYLHPGAAAACKWPLLVSVVSRGCKALSVASSQHLVSDLYCTCTAQCVECSCHVGTDRCTYVFPTSAELVLRIVTYRYSPSPVVNITRTTDAM